MQIKTISGTVTAIGKHFRESEANYYDFVELKGADGQYTKYHNLTVANDCARAMNVGDTLSIVGCEDRTIRHKLFPTTKGMFTVYAIYSVKADRMFDDVRMLDTQTKQLDGNAKRGYVVLGGLALFLLICAARGGSLGMALFVLIAGGMLGGIMYRIMCYPAKKVRSLMANEEEIAPHVAELHKLVGVVHGHRQQGQCL